MEAVANNSHSGISTVLHLWRHKFAYFLQFDNHNMVTCTIIFYMCGAKAHGIQAQAFYSHRQQPKVECFPFDAF